MLNELLLDVPEKPINPVAVILCALSAHILPRCTTLSHVDPWESFARCDAARSRATFCEGVSFGGAGSIGIRVPLYGAFDVAVGAVCVNNVGSVGIVLEAGPFCLICLYGCFN
jgi:hypothetical protein